MSLTKGWVDEMFGNVLKVGRCTAQLYMLGMHQLLFDKNVSKTKTLSTSLVVNGHDTSSVAALRLKTSSGSLSSSARNWGEITIHGDSADAPGKRQILHSPHSVGLGLDIFHLTSWCCDVENSVFVLFSASTRNSAR